MISYLHGKIISRDKDTITLLTSGGVGYDIRLTLTHVMKYSLEQEVSIFTYLKVSDSDLQLYGFASVDERAFFTLLLTVSGVGPKTAMNILGLGSMDKIQSAIARGDVKYLTSVSGLGKKTAERLVVELKNKIGNQESRIMHQGGVSDALTEVVEALVGMGYGREEARQAAEAVYDTTATTGVLLKLALQMLSRS